MSSRCSECRFMSRAGCRVDVCAVERAARLGRGEPPLGSRVKVAGPEPLGTNGQAGYLISWDGGRQEFAPTDAGYIEARGRQGQLEEVGITATFGELFRDIDALDTNTAAAI